MRSKFFVGLLIISLLLTGCSSAAKSSENVASDMGFAPAAMPPMEQSAREEMGLEPAYDEADKLK